MQSNTDRKYISLYDTAFNFMQFLCKVMRGDATESELNEFKEAVNVLSQDPVFNKSIDFITEKDLEKNQNTALILHKKYQNPAIFLIHRKLQPQQEIPASLDFDDKQKAFNIFSDNSIVLCVRGYHVKDPSEKNYIVTAISD